MAPTKFGYYLTIVSCAVVLMAIQNLLAYRSHRSQTQIHCKDAVSDPPTTCLPCKNESVATILCMNESTAPKDIDRKDEGDCISSSDALASFLANVETYRGCYSDEERVLQALVALSPDGNKIFVDVGANRGFTTTLVFNLFGRLIYRLDDSSRFPTFALPANLTDNASIRQVGHVHTVQGKGPTNWCLMDETRTPRVFAFEPDRTNFAMLQDAVASLHNSTSAVGTFAVPHDALVLRNVAVSKERGQMPFGFGGGEISSFKFIWKGEPQSMVDVVTLDEELLDRDPPVQRINFVKTDTEGHDWWVMQGAKRLLERGLVDMWFFEYHGVGLWSPDFGDGHVTLRHVTVYLDSLAYDSYFVGHRGLTKISGRHWRDGYEVRMWSNVLAIRRDYPLHRKLLLLLNDWRLPCEER